MKNSLSAIIALIFIFSSNAYAVIYCNSNNQCVGVNSCTDNGDGTFTTETGPGTNTYTGGVCAIAAPVEEEIATPVEEGNATPKKEIKEKYRR